MSLNDPYAQTDADHDREETEAWDLSIAIERRMAEILADPNLLDEAIGDQVYGAMFNHGVFIQARYGIASASSDDELLVAARKFRVELIRMAGKQATEELTGKKNVPMLLRKQAE